MRERSGLLDRQPRDWKIRQGRRFASKGHFAPAREINQIGIHQEHTAPGGSSALFEGKLRHSLSQRLTQRKLGCRFPGAGSECIEELAIDRIDGVQHLGNDAGLTSPGGVVGVLRRRFRG